MRLFPYSFIFAVLLFSPFFAFAQLDIGVSSITPTPRYPSPNSDVVLKFTSYEGDLESAMISWFQDGKLISQERGLREIPIKTPGVGKRAAITVIAELTNGKRLTEEYVLRANEVALIINAKAYTPPLYQGRGLPTVGGEYTITAFPELYTPSGVKIDPNKLSYEWWSDGGKFSQKKGRSATMTNSFFAREIRVSVTATDHATGARGEAMITIPELSPSVVLYENHPLWGIWYNSALPKKFTLDKKELAVSAEPYDFAGESPISSLIFNWGIPGSVAPFRSNGNTLVFKPAEGQKGSSHISLKVNPGGKAVNAMFQQAVGSFTVLFDADNLVEVQTVTERELPVF